MRPRKIAPSAPLAYWPLWCRPNGCGVSHRGFLGPVEAYAPPWPRQLQL